MCNSIKIDKSKTYSYIGDMNKTFYSIIKIIPNSVIDELTSISLGKLVDTIYNSWQKTKKIHEKNIINEGCVWDEKNKKMIELCQK